MASKQKQNAISLIKANIEKILAFEIGTDLVKIEVLGQELNFSEGRDIFNKVASNLSKLDNLIWEDLPLAQLNNFNTLGLTPIVNSLNSIKGFSTTVPNPKGTRDSLLTGLETGYDAFLTHIQPFLLTLNSNADNAQVKDEIYNLFNESSIIKKQLDEILIASKGTATSTGISRYSNIFIDEANQFKINARIWLVATIILLVIIPFLSFNFNKCYDLGVAPKDFDLINYSLTKILILTALFYGISITMRNFKANKHNEVTNKHRHNALVTFDVFIKSADENDIQTKNAILMEVCRTIFASQQTGYLNNEGESESPNKIIEIIKSTTSNK